MLYPKGSPWNFTVLRKKEIHRALITKWRSHQCHCPKMSQGNPMPYSGPPPDPQVQTYQQPAQSPQQNQQQYAQQNPQSPQQNPQADKNGGGDNGETTKMLGKAALKAGETLGEMEESWRIRIRVGNCLDVSYFLSVVSVPQRGRCNHWPNAINVVSESTFPDCKVRVPKPWHQWGNRVTSFPTFADKCPQFFLGKNSRTV